MESGSGSPTVSIITPTYNSAPYLAEAVESARAQTFADFELIVVDDGSTDETRAIASDLAERDPRVRLLAKDHGGLAVARNVAMKQARGAYFAFLDSDDLWSPEFLASQMAIFHRRPATDVVTGNAVSLGGKLDGRPLNPPGTECRPVSLLDMIEDEALVTVMSVFRRTVFEATGGHDEGLSRSEDYDLWIRAAHLGFRFVQNPQPLACYRRRPDSLSADELAMLAAIILVLNRARQLCATSPRVVTAIDRQLARFEDARVLTSAKTNLLGRQYHAAAHEFARLHELRRDVESRVIAAVSRHMPGLLRLAYRTKTALRV
jgi:glycosyltransferase involved in cell wall biosynthesis